MMGKLGLILLGAAAGVVGTGVAAWLYDEHSGSSRSSSRSSYACDSDDEDPDDQAECLENRRGELAEKMEALQKQRAEMDEEIKAVKLQHGEVERLLADLNAAFTVKDQAASDEDSTGKQADFDDAHAEATA